MYVNLIIVSANYYSLCCYFIIIVFFVFLQGDSLKCYNCGFNLTDIVSKQRCGDPFFKDDSLLIDCESLEHIGCAKVDIGGMYIYLIIM